MRSASSTAPASWWPMACCNSLVVAASRSKSGAIVFCASFSTTRPREWLVNSRPRYPCPRDFGKSPLHEVGQVRRDFLGRTERRAWKPGGDLRASVPDLRKNRMDDEI